MNELQHKETAMTNKNPPVAKKQVGRKLWQPDYAFIENQARIGLNDKEIAGLCGITHQVFCSKKNEYPELIHALAQGRAKGISTAALALQKLIAQGDRQAIQFYLERKGNWRIDSPSVVVETSSNTKITLATVYKELNSLA